jgi:hypothetical protein
MQQWAMKWQEQVTKWQVWMLALMLPQGLTWLHLH